MPTVETGGSISQEKLFEALLHELNSLPRDEPVRFPAPEPPAAPGNSLVELAAGSFAAEVARIWAGSRIGDYLSAPDSRRHLWHCWLASDRAGLERKFNADPVAIHHRLTSGRGRGLMAAAYGRCPPGLIQALGKVGAKARQPGFYRALVQALGREDLGAKFIRHSQSLPEILILNIAATPERLQSKPLFEALRRGTIGFDDMSHLVWAIARLEALGTGGAAENILNAGKPLTALREAFRALPFPAPPWKGDDRLRPITSRDALQQVGQRLENCIGQPEAADQAVSEVLREVHAFYEWTGDEPALLCFENASPLGWVLANGSGIKNARLSWETWGEIERTLTQCPAFAPIWVDGDGDVIGTRFLHSVF